jgi:hypothetical protein
MDYLFTPPEDKEGWVLIFRMTITDPKTGKIRRRSNGRPWPIWIRK